MRERKVCDTIVFEELGVTKVRVKKLCVCVKELCATKLFVKELCVKELFVKGLCV